MTLSGIYQQAEMAPRQQNILLSRVVSASLPVLLLQFHESSFPSCLPL